MEAEELKSDAYRPTCSRYWRAAGVGPRLPGLRRRSGQSNVAVLSYELWQRRRADPSSPASRSPAGSSYTVWRAAGRFFADRTSVDVWTPLNFDINDPRVASGPQPHRNARCAGVTFEQAVSEFDSMGPARAAYPRSTAISRRVRPLAEQIVGKTRQALLVLRLGAWAAAGSRAPT